MARRGAARSQCGARLLRQSPLFAAAAASLALGIVANAVIFSRRARAYTRH